MKADWLLPILERANAIASSSQLDELLERMLDLILEVCNGEAGTLYLLDEEGRDLIFKVVKEIDASGPSPLVGKHMDARAGLAGAALFERIPIIVDDVEHDPRWNRGFQEVNGRKLRNMICFPLLLPDRAIGVVQIFNYVRSELQVIQLLGNRMASEVDKAMLLNASRDRSSRLQALVDIIGQIGSSLDRDEILRMIIDYGRLLLGAEACSLFLLEEASGDLLPYMATNIDPETIQSLRVPAGKGVIGYVVRTGKTVRVTDTSQDERFYAGMDQNLGFFSHDILAVPLRARKVRLGSERGEADERIIGGLEAINKLEGSFNREDEQLLETLANQAATVLQIADLYTNANDLFLGVVRALTAAIDAKDPYTEGHSQRVSDYSVAIARELGADLEVIHHLRIAGLLHDVGKIGISDAILRKPGRLDPQEFEEIKRHPGIGEKIMRQVRMLETELPGIAQHHERLDGRGYPSGLTGDALSLTGRIVAVADVFDALTSERPYRKGETAEQAISVLCSEQGTHFDPCCVEALMRARQKGNIHTQKEMEA